MKRKIVIIVSIILILIMVSLYYTYAINVTMDQTSGDADLTFNINLEDTTARSITVEAGTTKYFDIFITNTNAATINYGLAYNNVENSSITVAQLNESKNAASDLIDSNTTYQISLTIKNDTQSSITYNIVPVVGYVNGGDLVVPSNHTLITDVYEHKTNSISGTVSDWINVNGSGSVLGAEGSGSSNLDTTGANSPDLLEGLIPVMYDGSKWVTASSENDDETYQWYDYNAKKWANAVLVSSTNRSTYQSADPGTVVSESDVLAYYVWIPRYKYKVWNVTKTIGTDSYDAQTTGIDISFETETETTGTITCNNYSFASPTSTTPNETCSGSNGDYYTHPAFTFGDDEVRGIWVGKYEVANTISNIRIKENMTTLTDLDITTFSSVIQNMDTNGNEYGLSTDSDSHMIKNIEWGSIVYLTNSNYGKCNGKSCSNVMLNSYLLDTETLYKTGCGPQSTESIDYAAVCNLYNTELGQLSSTTGNVYGVYDMSGGAWENTMGNVSSAAGNYTYNASLGGKNFTYSEATAKYIDTYAYGSSNADQTAYNRARLGDATGEITNTSGQGWYNNFADFVYSTNENEWFIRGGFSDFGEYAGIFSFDGTVGDVNFYTSRAILVSLN